MNQAPLMTAIGLFSLGILAMLTRRTILGILLGFQTTALGAALAAVVVGKESEVLVKGQLLGLIFLLGGVIPLIGGFSFSVRLFYLRTKATLDELENLKG
ncbi:MAG: hypothetical protein JNL01_10510 [Bdellovibrionales bacterium]|nr:hypothetical protein [Bdellovibrionales bacterium]